MTAAWCSLSRMNIQICHLKITSKKLISPEISFFMRNTCNKAKYLVYFEYGYTPISFSDRKTQCHDQLLFLGCFYAHIETGTVYRKICQESCPICYHTAYSISPAHHRSHTDTELCFGHHLWFYLGARRIICLVFCTSRTPRKWHL